MPAYVRFQQPGGPVRAGILEGDAIAVVPEPIWDGPAPTGETVALADVRLLAPCEPRSIVCVGLNYASHLQGRPVPNPPTLFFKPLSSIAGPGDAIVLPRDSGRVDPEGEVVVVIGKTLRNVDREGALAGIFGYTAGNDVSSRRWQRGDDKGPGDGQWWRAKGSDTFGVFGPAIVTGLAYDDIELETRVNGQRAQHALTSELILDIPEIVRYIASVMTLVPGDIIYTGTPGEPPQLNPGDIVEVEISGNVVLSNPVVPQS